MALPICETCREYGDVHKLKFKETGEVVYVCYECSAMWNDKQEFLEIILDEFFEQRNITKKFEEAFEEIE